jgi:hypothetical protein
MATEEDIARLVVLLSAAFPNWNVNEYTNEVYYLDLSDIPTDELFVAAQHCRTEPGRKFAPSTGEIRGAVAELRGMTNNVPSSFEAWQEVLREFSDTGSYGTPKFSHPLIGRAVNAMGWKNLCLSEDQTADRARFLQCYEQFRERATREEIMLPEVRGYLMANGAQLMAPMDSIKLLSDKLSVSKPKEKVTK